MSGVQLSDNNVYVGNAIRESCLTNAMTLDIILLSMAASFPEDSKSKALRAHGALHRHPERVVDEEFHAHEFFDPRDRIQVKYEMLRRHHTEGRPVRKVAASFGVSRQAFYKTDASFKEGGIPGLLPRRPGPKGAHKCTNEILDFVEEWRASPAAEGGKDVVEAVERRFDVTLHPRSIDRALRQRKKKRQAGRRT